ncbi:MAG: hypothetical protein AAGG01_15420 [Planctomycetota bacterium]
MKATTAAIVSSFAFGVGGVATFLTLGPGSSAQASEDSSQLNLAAQDSTEDLAQAVSELRAEIKGLKKRSELAQVSGGRMEANISDEAIARAVAAYFENAGETPTQIDPLDGAPKALGSAEDIAQLLGDADDLASVGLWKRIVEEGRDAEVLAHFKALADANPNDPEAQLELGQAYLGRTQEAGASPLAGKYATLADEALDAALEADPEHWEARFTKAVALSFWPPVFGKQAEAIQEYETLVGQQSGLAPSSEHAQTHLLLGNMYHQTGQSDKALAAWRAGLELFPDNSDLASQIAILTGGN